ncbi:hypothetical protein BDN70DRAFT_890287 [Pholiota conissans]|uniref:Chromo domain-containing protein n=1 Tax=Pholiota conissans TaxID=109636 RepID=A0A9P5ZEX2_9AGAR|nr:hypothetical protein BDN70DRAFT_890287 [Pholiota conissans]
MHLNPWCKSDFLFYFSKSQPKAFHTFLMVKQKSQQQWPVQVITKAERRAYSPTCFEHNDLNAEADWNYRVKWEGYGSEDDSWEPYQHVQSCVRLLASFWDHVGINNKHDVSCRNVTASEDWIEDWINIIERDERPPGKTVNTKNQRQMVQRRKDKKKHTCGPSFVSIPSSSKVAEDESGKDSAQGEPPKLSLKIKLPPGNLNKRRVIGSPASDEESLAEGSRPRKVARTQADGNTDAGDNETPLSPNSLFSEWLATETTLVEAVQESQLIKLTEPKIVPISSISTKQCLASGALTPTTPKEIMDQSRRINSNPLFINRSGARGLKSNQKPFQQVHSTVSESTISFNTGFQSFTLEHTTEFPREFRDIRYLYSDWLGMNTFEPSAIMPIETLACERIKEATIWTGPLHLDSEIALCNIKIHDATETMFNNISDILLDKEKIEVSGTYDISDIQSALSAFRQPLQIGLLYPREEADSESLGILSKYLYKLKRMASKKSIQYTNLSNSS